MILRPASSNFRIHSILKYSLNPFRGKKERKKKHLKDHKSQRKISEKDKYAFFSLKIVYSFQTLS